MNKEKENFNNDGKFHAEENYVAYEVAHYQLNKDVSGQWYWIFKAKNSKTIARSSESYHNRSDCIDSIHLIKQSNASPVWDMTTNPVKQIE